jgi:hypothetical protein
MLPSLFPRRWPHRDARSLPQGTRGICHEHGAHPEEHPPKGRQLSTTKAEAIKPKTPCGSSKTPCGSSLLKKRRRGDPSPFGQIDLISTVRPRATPPPAHGACPRERKSTKQLQAKNERFPRPNPETSFPWGRSEAATRPGLLRDFEFAGRSLPRNFRPCSDARGQAGSIAASERPL